MEVFNQNKGTPNMGARHWNEGAMRQAEDSEFDDKSAYLRQLKEVKEADREAALDLIGETGAQKRKPAYRGLSPEVIAVATDVLDVTRTELMVSYRFLDRALWKMPFKPSEAIINVGTDGIDFNFNPVQVAQAYAASTNEAVRTYLHLILHCVFYHPFIGNDVSLLAWNLASDIVAEQSCMELAGERFPSKNDHERLRVIEALKGKLGNLSAEKIYAHILDNGMTPQEAEILEKLFKRDDHAPWYKDRPLEEDEQEQANKGETSPDTDPQEVPEKPDEDNGSNAGEKQAPDAGDGNKDTSRQDTQNEADETDEGNDQEANESDTDEGTDSSESNSEGNDDGSSDSSKWDGESTGQNQTEQDGPDGQGKKQWEDISKQLRVELETRSRQFGTEAGTLAQQLQVANRRRYDFRDFLRRFTQIDEEMTINDDEFDLVSYTYGLKVFGNLPLIEPLEYKENRKIKEFVIAVDTSESCDGILIKRFVEEAFSILKTAESFFTDINVHIIQCDARVQSDIKITSQSELDSYMHTFSVYGLGGTDFRPVFQRVDKLIEQGEFENLRGLIYFTDGFGTFPATPPNYETVFVFVDDGFGSPTVPAWAYKLVLDSADILNGDERGAIK